MEGIHKNAPAGTKWFGGPVEWFSISLRIIGEDIKPESISALLKSTADSEMHKGDAIQNRAGKTMRIAESGKWEKNYTPELIPEPDYSAALLKVFETINKEVQVWTEITGKAKVDIFIGVVMKSENKGIELDPELMKFLGERNIKIGFDIYYEKEDL